MRNLTHIKLIPMQVPVQRPTWMHPTFGGTALGTVTKLAIHAGTVCPNCRQARGRSEGLGYHGLFEQRDITIRCGTCGVTFGPTDLDIQEINRQAEETPR